jgi:hypothetical protein
MRWTDLECSPTVRHLLLSHCHLKKAHLTRLEAELVQTLILTSLKNIYKEITQN